MSAVAVPAPRRRSARRFAVRTASFACWFTFGLGVVFATFVVAPSVVGLHSFAILSGSMEPTLRVGDLVIDGRIRAADARPGDIITFRDPQRASRLITHRIVRYGVRGSRAYIVTKGDANSGVETWSMPLDGTLGRVEFAIPELGYAMMNAGGRFGRLGLIVIPALLLALYELKRLWLPKRRPDDP